MVPARCPKFPVSNTVCPGQSLFAKSPVSPRPCPCCDRGGVRCSEGWEHAVAVRKVHAFGSHAAFCRRAGAAVPVAPSELPGLLDSDEENSQARLPPLPSRRTIARPLALLRLLFLHKELRDRGSRDRQTQRDMPCLRRILSNASLAGRVRPWATSSSPCRIPSSESARAAISSNL